MRELYAERKSGVLEISRQSIKKRLHFKNGVAIFADSGNGKPQTREQAELLAYSLFTWTSGEFVFEEGEPQIDDALAFEGSPSTVILAGSRSIAEPEILEQLIGGSESIFSCTQTSVLPLFKMKLSPAENAILTFARARDRFTLEELPLPSHDLPVLSALNALVAVGLLEIVKPPEPEPPLALPAPAAPEPFAGAPPKPAPITATPPPPPVAAAPTTPPPAPVSAAPPSPPPTPAATAPEPPAQSDSIMPEVPSDMEHLLNAFEAKRTGVARPPKPAAPAPTSQPPAPAPRAAPAPPPQPEPVPEPEAIIEATVAPPESTLVDAKPPPVQPVVEAAPALVARQEQPVAPSPPEGAPVQAARPPAANGPSLAARLGEWMSAVAEFLPRGKARLIAGGSIVFVGAALALVLLLTSGNDEASTSDAVVAADSSGPGEVPAPEPPAPRPAPQPPEEPEPVPSEAELFYRANLAFESGEFEQAKAELMILLELKPDLTAAQNLMAKVEHELAPKPPPPKPEPRRPARQTPEPKPEPKPDPKPVAPPPPTPAELLASARNALASGELETAEAKLTELEAVDATYPGADELQAQINEGYWKRKLPLAYSTRHDHALGGCDGVLTLTRRGIGYGSDDHQWFWNFPEIRVIDRRDARRLRLEANSGESYNFELRDNLANDDWARYQRLMSR